MERKDLPILKTFVYKNKYYYYDTYLNRLFGVSQEQFVEINELKKIGLYKYCNLNKDTDAYYQIKMLISKGLMSAQVVLEIEHPMLRYVNDIVDRSINDITLQVTRDCNFRCRYCLFANNNGIERNHEKVNMSWTTAKKCIDYLYDHSKDSDQVTISFYGGEPMLNYELIKQVVDYAETKFFTKKILYRMTFNASILPNEAIDFFIEHDFHITISFDGPQEIQNKHRKFLKSGAGTFSTVYNNINNLRNRNSKYFYKNVTFIPVVFEDEDETDILNYYHGLSIPKDNILMLDADMTGVDYYSIEDVDFAQKRINYSADEATYAKKTLLPSKWHHNGPCIPAIKSMFVDVNGLFYPCEGVISESELSIGDINKGINIDKVIEYMNIGSITEQECKSCWLMRFCSICFLKCIDVDNKTITKKQKLIACKGQEERVVSFLKKHIDNNLK